MGVRTDRRVKKVVHGIAKGVLAIPRTSFILMLKANIWGLATVIRAAMKNPDLKKKWQIGWYNLGGNFGDFNHAIIKGYTRKAIAIKLAPDKIKEFYKSAKSRVTGIGAEPASTGAIILSAAKITLAVLDIILKSLQFAASRAEIPQEEDNFNWDLEEEENITYDNGEIVVKTNLPTPDFLKNVDTTSNNSPYVQYIDDYLKDPNNPNFYDGNGEEEENNNLLLLGAAAAALLLFKK